MATTYPYQSQYAFVVDKFQLDPKTQKDMSSLLIEEESTASGILFPSNLPYECLQESPSNAERIFESIHAADENSSMKVPFTYTTDQYSSAIIINHNSSSPSVVVDLENYCKEDQVTQVTTPTMGQMRKHSLPIRKVKRESKGKKRKPKSSVSENAESSRPAKKQKKVPAVEPPTGYVHVRARRGEATDSHSLAERVRREKISTRMKRLQSLVPGCDMITGKASILDEIIRYVQSLKDRVESLEALVSVNGTLSNDSEVNFNTETPAWQELFTSELQLPFPLQYSESSQLLSFVEKTDHAPTSLLQPLVKYY